MKSLVACLMGLMILIQSDATQQPTVSGHVRLSDGLPVAGAQVMLFDVTDLRRGVVAYATTDEAGQFALPLAALGRLALPQGFALGTNYPNPFNPATIIPYELAAISPVKLEVFNILGQRIATLVDGNQEAGSYQAQWDGTDAAGQAAAAGLYFYRLTVDGVPQTGRMVLVDGQAGIPMRGGSIGAQPLAESPGAAYGLVVSGPGMVAYVDADFGVEAGMGPVDIAVEARRDGRMQGTPSGMLGDVDNNGQVDIADGLLVAAYSINPATALPNNGDIARGDVNGDNQTDITDAWLLATYKGDLAALGLSGRGKAVSTLSSDMLLSDDFSNLSQWTTDNGGSGSIEVENGALKLVGTSGSNYIVKVSKEIFPTKTYSNYELSFDWKSTVKETPDGINYVSATFYDSADGYLGSLIAIHTVSSNSNSLIHHFGPPNVDPGRYGGSLKASGPFGWELVTINTFTAAPLINTGDVHKIVVSVEVSNSGGSGGDLYVDNLSFKGISGKIYWADGSGQKIQRANLDGSQVQDLVTGLGGIDGLALDASGGKMFWTERDANKIRRANLDGSQVQDLVTGLDEPIEIALDMSVGKMYWVDFNRDKIQRANLDGSQVQDIVSGVDRPHGLALDVSGGKLYWVEYNGSVHRSNMDGSQKQAIITGLGQTPHGIALDVSRGKLYWTESGSGKIRRSNLDGSQVQDVVAGLSEPRGIALSGGKMYWTEAGGGRIGRSNLDGSQVENVVTGLGYVRGIALQVSGQIQSPPQGQPDLVVTLSASPNPVESGSSFTLSATVTNQGDAASASTTVNFYLLSEAASTTSTGESPGVPASGSQGVSVSGLAARASAVVTMNVQAENVTTETTFNYNACVDAVSNESNTDNNCSSRESVTVVPNIIEEPDPLGQPDLVVSSAYVDDDTPSAGDRIRIYATVLNQGTATAPASRLGYYLSNDATYSSNDTYLDYDNVRSLAPGESSDENERLDVPSVSGTYYIIVCADADNNVSESNESNNCTVVGFGISPPPGDPDLVVSSAYVDDDTPSVGDRIRMYATVLNQGTATASSSTLRYFWSNDNTCSEADYAGSDRVRSLDPGESDDEDRTVDVPSIAGTYYLIAYADAEYAVSESNENNNCKAVRVVVSDPGVQDLEVVSASVSNSNPSPGANITLTVTVRNAGSARSSRRSFAFWRSTDRSLGNDTTEDFLDRLPALDPGETWTTTSDPFSAPSNPGTYYYIACIGSDSDSGETNYTNDCSDGSKAPEVIVSPPGVQDLEVVSASVSNSNPSPRENITLTVTVRNAGSARSSRRSFAFWRSTDRSLGNDTTEDFLDRLPALDPGETWTTTSDPFSAPSNPGTYYYIACIGSDSDSGETNYTNDCSDGSKAPEVIVGDSSQPDLVVSSASVDDDTPSAGDRIRMYVTVRNRGDETASSSKLYYYRSDDDTYSSDDTYLDYDNVPSLDANETEDENEFLDAPSSSGTYYYIACADAEYDVSESNENNNCTEGTAAVRVVVPGGDPDLVVSSASVDDDTPSAGDRIRMYATVRNRGDETASSSKLYYYRSDDDTYSSDDLYLDYDNVPSLDANETEDENERLDAPSSPGTYYYIACADAEYDVSESNENNNCTEGTAAVRVVVPGGDPDLVVSSASVDDDTPSAGDRIRMYVTVRNRGDETASSSKLYYYRSDDDTYSSDDLYLDYDNVPSLDPGETEDENERLDAPSSSGTYYYIACADAEYDVSESNENNNCTEGTAAVRVVVPGGGSEVNIGDLSTPYVYGSSNDSVNRDSNDKDYYRFTLTQQRTMLIELRNLSGDADLYLEDANKNVLASSSSGGTSNEEIYYSLEAGTYYIRVDAYASGTINYRLRYRSEYVFIENFGDITSSTVTVTLPTGHVNKSSNDRDYFSFTLSSTRTVRIELINLSGDADLVLENNERTVIRSSNNSGTSAELIERSLSSGYYRIGVKAYGSGTISYQLRYSVP